MVYIILGWSFLGIGLGLICAGCFKLALVALTLALVYFVNNIIMGSLGENDEE